MLQKSYKAIFLQQEVVNAVRICEFRSCRDELTTRNLQSICGAMTAQSDECWLANMEVLT